MLLSLIAKELRLQRMILAFAGVIFMIWLIAYIFAGPLTRLLSTPALGNTNPLEVLDWAAIAPCLLFFVPLMLGISTALPERILGTMEWQLSLPVTHRRQWLVKCLVAGGLALLIGGVLYPVMNKLLAMRLNAILGSMKSLLDVAFPSENLEIHFIRRYRVLWLLVGPLAAVASGAYVSSLLRGGWVLALVIGAAPGLALFFLPRWLTALRFFIRGNP